MTDPHADRLGVVVPFLVDWGESPALAATLGTPGGGTSVLHGGRPIG